MTLKQARKIIFDLFQCHHIHHQRRKIIKAAIVTMNDPVSYDKECRFYHVAKLGYQPRPTVEGGK